MIKDRYRMVEAREFKSMPGKAGTTGRKGISPKDRKSARGSGSGPTQKMRRSVTNVERYLRKMNFLYPCCVFHIGNRSWVFFCTVIFCLLSKQFRNEGDIPEWRVKLFVDTQHIANTSRSPNSACSHSSSCPL